MTIANTQFAFKLFTTLAEREHGKNIFISPASIALALGLAANGARGATWHAIAHTLELGAADLDALNAANAKLIHELGRLDPQLTIAVANSIWLRQDITLDPEFARRCQMFYGAEASNIDFADAQAASRINGWVKERTNSKIDRIVDQVGRDALVFLINAIYFKGRWARPFDPRLTTHGQFTPAGGQPRQHPLMAQRGSYAYYETSDFQAVSLPYGDGRVVMDIVLPAPRARLADFCRSLSGTEWERWQSRFAQTEGSLQLPRFKLAYETSLNDALKALGMEVAFSPAADFSALSRSERRIRIDEVKHKTFVEVNEQGTEAAAVTSVGMMRATFMPKKTFRMVVDRPFFCAIRDSHTGALLFLGAIVDPSIAS